MKDSPAKALFEYLFDIYLARITLNFQIYQQASAEGITERLSELFHTPVETMAKAPLEFVNYVRVTKKVRLTVYLERTNTLTVYK